MGHAACINQIHCQMKRIQHQSFMCQNPGTLLLRSKKACKWMSILPNGGFLMGVPPVLIHLSRIFHEINHAAIGVPSSMETQTFIDADRSGQHLFSNLCFAGPARRLGARHGAERRSSKAFVRLSTLGFSRFPKLVSSQSPKTQVISLFAYHGLVSPSFKYHQIPRLCIVRIISI